MAKNTFHCAIVTPTEAVLDEEVTYASIPAWDGQRGVMYGGSPMLTKLGTGPLRLDFAEGGSRTLLVDGGFAQFQNNSLSLLSDDAISEERINLEEAKAELAEASARVMDAANDREKVMRDQQRARVKVSIAEAFTAGGRAI